MDLDFLKAVHKVRWSDQDIEYMGVPFMILGTKIFDCHHGKHRNYKRKQDANKKIEYDWVCF